MQSKLRKVLALIVSVLMLCTLLPLGAISPVSAADETVVSWNFEDGDVGFTSGTGQSIVVDPDNSANHVLYWQGASAWGVIYKVITLEKNTDYAVDFKVKTSAGGSAYITWEVASWGTYDQKSFSTKTTWSEQHIEFNTGDKFDKVMLKIQNGSTAQDFWVDDFKVTKKEKAAAPEGGAGETTYETKFETDWNDGVLKFKNGNVVAEGPDGSNCMKWSAGGNYSNTSYTINGMEQNTDYLVTFKMKTSNAKKLFITMQAYSDGSYGNVSFATTTTWEEYEIVINTKDYVNSEGKMRFKFQDTGAAQDVWVDDLVVSKIIEPEVEEDDEGNLVIDGGFENNGNGWQFKSGSHAFVSDAHSGDYALELTNPGQWGEAAIQTIDVNPGQQYELTFWFKRTAAVGTFNIIVAQGYSPYAQFTKVSGDNNYMNKVTDGWEKRTIVYASGDNTKMMLKFTTESSSVGTILIDDVSVKELRQPSDDGFIKNGDFETGNTAPWTTYLQTAVAKEAANNGKYGLMVTGNGSGYPGLAYQDFATEVGHRYAVTFSYKAVSSGVNVQINQGDATVASKYLSGTSWANYTLEFDAVDTTAKINICGSGNNVTDTVYFDDFKVVEVKEPSFDGYIWNGDFEAGSTTRWEVNKETALSTTAAKNGKYGAILKGPANWGGLLTQKNIAVEVGKTYKLSFWYKTPKNGLNMTLKDQDNQNTQLAGKYLSGKQDWTLYEATFESGYVTKLILNFSGSGKAESNPSAIDELWIDDIKLECLSGDEMDRCEIMKNSGTSIRDVDDDHRGLAFRFAVNVTGAQFVKGNEYVSGSGSMKLFKYDEAIGTLIEAGAIVSNNSAVGDNLTMDAVDGKKTIKIPAKYMTDYDEKTGDMYYAVRIVNIPDEGVSTQIYARPYYIYEINGEQVTVYGNTNDENYEAVASARRSLKILAIGNSFSVDAMKNYLYDVLKSAEYDQVILGNLYVGGCSIDTHWNYISANSGSYEYHKNDDNGKWVTTYGAKAMDALQDENWDIITVQQVSSNSGQPETFGNLQNLVNWVNQYKTNPSAKVLWHMTWAYQQDSTHEAFPNYGSNQLTMYNAIVSTVQNTVLNIDGIDGVIPAGTAIQNLRQTSIGDTLTADGYHLNDQHGDYTASLTWYAAITGESLDLVDYAPASVINDVFNIKRAVGRAIINPYEISNMGETILLAGSDFQASTWEKNFKNINAILGGIESTDGYTLFDGFLCPGDYTPNHGHENATEGIAELDSFLDSFVIGNKVYAEGNHDAPTVEMLSPSGNNDPVGGTYGVYVIHEEEYGQFGAGKSTELYDELKAYFAEKTASGWNKNKPIFVITHVPLHYNWRTVSDYGGGKNAKYIVDALNEASEEGYNVIHLYGHNHSGDYDAYLGGASIYLAKGDTMLIANPANYKEWQETEIKFTYLNAGYMGYHPDFGIGMDYALTLTTFKIQDNGEVIITRYDQNGYHVLKAKGVHHVQNEYVNDYPINETVYGPQHKVTATTDEELIAP